LPEPADTTENDTARTPYLVRRRNRPAWMTPAAIRSPPSTPPPIPQCPGERLAGRYNPLPAAAAISRNARARAGRCSRPPRQGSIRSARESARRARTPLDGAQIGHEACPETRRGMARHFRWEVREGRQAENSCLQSTHRALSRPGSCGLEGWIEGRPCRRRSHRRRL